MAATLTSPNAIYSVRSIGHPVHPASPRTPTMLDIKISIGHTTALKDPRSKLVIIRQKIIEIINAR